MSIKVFKDPNYQTELQTPVRLSIGTLVYIELWVNQSKLQDCDEGAKIILSSCVAFPYLNSDSSLNPIVINERTAVDDISQMLSSRQLNTVRFKMQTFKIGINFREVYLRCYAFLCPSNDKSATCNDDRAKAQHITNATRQKEKFVAAEGLQQIKSVIHLESSVPGVLP